MKTRYKYKRVTLAEAKKEYCNGNEVYILTEEKDMYTLHSTDKYGSHDNAENLFYRGLPERQDSIEFYTEWKPGWNMVMEAETEEGNITMWSMDISGTELEVLLNSRFIWIEENPHGLFDIYIYHYISEEWIEKHTCKTLASAKRWVTMNLL